MRHRMLTLGFFLVLALSVNSNVNSHWAPTVIAQQVEPEQSADPAPPAELSEESAQDPAPLVENQDEEKLTPSEPEGKDQPSPEGLKKDEDTKGETEAPKDEKKENDEIRLPFQMRGLARDEHRELSKRSKEMVALFKPLINSAEVSTVKILNGNRLITLGTIVDREGLILTKASELRGEINCSLVDGRKVSAVVLGVHPDTDLALLKVEATDLQPIHWGTDAVPVVGQWIVSPTFDANELQVGIIGVNARKVPPSSPFLGIRGPTTGADDVVGARVDGVEPNTPADEADIMVGDIITKIDEVEIKNWDDLRKTLGQYDPKDEVTLTIQRAQDEIKMKVILGDREKLSGGPNPQADRSTMQNNMGSRPSQRRKDFPIAFQHDLMLNKFTCGGPVVNLDGQVVGINIARAGRVDSLALPTSIVLPVLELLKSGEFAPAKVNQARLTEIEAELRDATVKLAEVPATGNLENQLAVEKARYEELERAKSEMKKALDELENRIQVVELKKSNFEKELKSIRTNRNGLDRRIQSLQRERKSLSSGIK